MQQLQPLFLKEVPVAYLHQVWSHHTPGPHHMEQRPVLVPHDAQHGLAQTEEMESAAAVQSRLSLSYRYTEGTNRLNQIT